MNNGIVTFLYKKFKNNLIKRQRLPLFQINNLIFQRAALENIGITLVLFIFTCGRLFIEASGQSLKGKTEYEVVSPSFLGSKGLFGLVGKPTNFLKN